MASFFYSLLATQPQTKPRQEPNRGLQLWEAILERPATVPILNLAHPPVAAGNPNGLFHINHANLRNDPPAVNGAAANRGYRLLEESLNILLDCFRGPST